MSPYASPSSPESTEAGPILAVTALIAVIVPALLAYNLPPSATFINQAAALMGWGAFLAALIHAISGATAPREGIDRGTGSLLGALGLLFLGAIGTLAVGKSTTALVASSAGLILAAMLAAMVGVAVARAGQAEAAFRALAIALVVAGILSTGVSLIQVYLPSLADSKIVAYPSVEGRASGNLRQPNHLCSLVLWSLVALAWMFERALLKRALAGAIGVAFVLTLVLSASRTGWIGVAMLFIWGCVDRRLSRSTRIGLALTLPMYWLIWFGLTAAAAAMHHVFYGQTRMGVQDFSSSRLAIWANTIEMIRQHPWFGVGWGEFNFAWSLTPFVKRPSAFFDHTHNIVLQFAVELGLPMALLVCALLVHALWRSLKNAMKATGAHAHMLSAAWMIVVMMVIHSQLEYPLWYAYFLLPTAFAFGLTLSKPMAPSLTPSTDAKPTRRSSALLLTASLALAAIGVASLFDYHRVVVVFEPPDDAPPLDQRIAAAEHSWFFAHHAYYADATVVPPADALPALANASHYLLDTRLMTAWAEALAANGQVDKARHIAARLREFNNADSRPFFEACEKPGVTLPFQCSPPEKVYRADDFR